MNKSELVYSSDIDVSQAVEAAFDALASDIRAVEQPAVVLNNHIQAAWMSSLTILPPIKPRDLFRHQRFSLTLFQQQLLVRRHFKRVPDVSDYHNQLLQTSVL